MAEETKKISFGFSKLKKPNVLVKLVEINKPHVDYVDSFDGAKGKFSYKGNVRCDEPVKKELVIPLIGTRTALDVIRSKLEEKKNDQKKNEENNEKVKSFNENISNGTIEKVSKEEVKETDDNVQLSIDDLAAKEIINELHNKAVEKASNTIVIKQPNKISKAEDEKDGPIDYESIPVNDFGLAMLRGMGWTPETGIGKEQKVVQVVTPKLRPKGLGLGADKAMLQQANINPDLTVSIKSYVQFSNGLHKGKYGQVESMDEDNGRVIVKLALGGTVSVSEMLLIPITKKDYDKSSKVLNPTTYESFKELDRHSGGKGKTVKEKSSSDGRRKTHDDNRHRKEKYDRRDRGTPSVGDSGSDDGRRGRRSTSSSSERIAGHKRKRKQARGDSPERKNKKTKKKRKKRRRHSSKEESDTSPERKHERERSRNHSHHSKSKKSNHR